MSDPLFKMLGIGGAGCREVFVDPEKVTKEEFVLADDNRYERHIYAWEPTEEPKA